MDFAVLTLTKVTLPLQSQVSLAPQLVVVGQHGLS